jgi:hypothetical protein
MVNAALGDGFKYEDFMIDLELEHLGTPLYPSYADDDDGETPQAHNADDANADAGPLTEAYDQFAGACVTFPIGDKMLSTEIRGCKQAP